MIAVRYTLGLRQIAGEVRDQLGYGQYDTWFSTIGWCSVACAVCHSKAGQGRAGLILQPLALHQVLTHCQTTASHTAHTIYDIATLHNML